MKKVIEVSSMKELSEVIHSFPKDVPFEVEIQLVEDDAYEK
ncbi:MAG: hypothetical protein UIC64_10200 [Agathobacter sp.]|nr:hypothetical protein [Agathobacter sp.]